VVDKGEEEFQVERFGEVLIGASIAETSNLAWRRVGRKYDDRDVGCRRVEAKSFQDIKTVDVGKCTSRSMRSG